MELPTLPVPLTEFIPYLKRHSDAPVAEVLDPFKAYENKLREVFAQEPENPVISNPKVNVVPIFAGHEGELKIRARDVDNEPKEEKDKYLFPLQKEVRKLSGAPATVTSLKDFKRNFNLFCESSLADLNWDNVIAGGSSVVTALLPVPKKWADSKRTQRDYYHDILAPASDVDLFLYGLNEEQAIAKIKEIETCIRDSILAETTTIRTKNAVTICSTYPTRHVQIVLRLYKSISEILTGFDVDSSCVAYDGSQVYASPRAIAAFATQINTIDLSRRSPSYENRLSKYSHRGFEVYWGGLERSRIDPTAFERSFARVVGLARLLVLEKLPTPIDRDEYLATRRAERGRPAIYDPFKHRRHLPGNKKDQQPDDVAEWVEADDVSNYHTFTVPYGPKYHAKKIEKLLYTKDLLLNAEWNRSKGRETELHRHPCFFGRVEDVIHDCCGYCPKPADEEDEELAEEEGKIYVSGEIAFIKDDPGRQAIGSFHPLTDCDWTEMAYVGNTTLLCQAIVDGDLEHVRAWCEQEGNDANRRDYTGRTPLHLATLCSTPEIVQCLVDYGARMIWRLVDGFTALHIAAWRGNAAMVKTLLEKSEANEEDEARKEDERKATKKSPSQDSKKDESGSESDEEDLVDDDSGSDESHTTTEGSFVKVRDEKPSGETMPDENDDDEPDVFDVNVLAWDSPLSPLHCAIMGGHIEVMELLVQTFGADVLLPVKLVDKYSRNPRSAILTLVLALQLDPKQSQAVTRKLIELGASSSQADMDQNSALHYVVQQGDLEILNLLFELDEPASRNAINHLSLSGSEWHANFSVPLLTAIREKKLDMVDRLLDLGAKPEISFESFMRSWQRKFEKASQDPESNKKKFRRTIEQPVTVAAQCGLPQLVSKLLAKGVNVNTMTKQSYQHIENPHYNRGGETILDIIRKRLDKLRKDKGESKDSVRPADLESDGHYLSGLRKGTYKEWAAKGDLEQAKSVHEEVLKDHKPQINESEQEGREKKMEETRIMIKELSEVEKDLVKRRAKTFDELHPKLKDTRRSNPTYRHHEVPAKPFKVGYHFFVPDLNKKSKEGYLQLFQAAWDGDTQKVKSLTLGTWGESYPPLRIALQDQRGFSPYSIAVYRGHLDLARAIVDIAAAQYHPKGDSGKRERFHLRDAYYSDGDSMDSDNEGGDEVHVFSELVDENFTIDDIGAVGNTVKSNVTPHVMVNWTAQFWRCLDMPELKAKKELACEGLTYNTFQQLYIDRNSRQRCSLNRYAIKKGDKLLLKSLIDLEIDLAARDQDDDETDTSKMHVISPADFKYAMTLDRIDILQEIILRTGHGIPIQRLIKKSGIEINEKPKYYQGLSVYGTKRKDWATAGRDTSNVNPEERHSPLHIAAFEGSLESLEWFLTDGPLRKYKEFVGNNQDNLYLKKLADAEGGVEKTLAGWLDARDHLALHAAVMEVVFKGDDSTKRIAMVLSKSPNALDRKSKEGITPLHLAFSLRRMPAARYLIKEGADQTLRDQCGRNVLHYILQPRNNKGIPPLRALKERFDLIDKRLVKSMFLERCSDTPTSLTPLALWLHGDFGKYDNDSHLELPDMLNLILDYSGNEVLELMDGAGDYPLHILVKKGYHTLIPVVLQRNPSLLFHENAVGMTPLEMCNTMRLRNYIDHPPSIRLGQYAAVPVPLDEKPPMDFVPKQAAPISDQVETYRICNEAAKADVGKRKLVSLFDANAVAKRLAGRKARRIGMELVADVPSAASRNEDEDDGADEVADWFNRAARISIP